MRSVNRRVLAGFSLSLGYTRFHLSLLVLIPLAACFLRAASLTFEQFWAAVWTPRTQAAYLVSFGAALAAAALNLVLRLLLAWLLVRYQFPLKRLFKGLVDLHLTLPAALAGLVCSSLWPACQSSGPGRLFPTFSDGAAMRWKKPSRSLFLDNHD
jgi:sulfate transport system permease protein